MSNPLFSVIVPTCHRNGELVRCLEKLAPRTQTMPACDYEVIVTDDGSTQTAETTLHEAFPWAQWVAGPRRGPAANRNNGAKRAHGTWLAFIDDDCLPDPQWLIAYAHAIRSLSNSHVFEGRVYVDRPRRSLAETTPLNENGGVLWSCNFAMKRELFDKIGGFDERYVHAAMEDVDMRLRLKKAGYVANFVKAASVLHPWRLHGGWKTFQRHYDSTVLYLSLHPEESATINSAYYLKMLVKATFSELPRCVVTFKGRGLSTTLVKYLSWLHASISLFCRHSPRNRSV